MAAILRSEMTTRLLRSVVALFVLMPPPAPGSNCPENPGITVPGAGGRLEHRDSGPSVEFDPRRNQLKLTAEGHSLDQVLNETTSATGIEFIGRVGRCEEVSITFDFLPLEQALARILRGRSYIVEEQPGSGVSRVWLLRGEGEDRLTESELAQRDFYNALQDNPETRKLADELRRLQAEHPDLAQPESR
jgi:hypothetical protein